MCIAGQIAAQKTKSSGDNLASYMENMARVREMRWSANVLDREAMLKDIQAKDAVERGTLESNQIGLAGGAMLAKGEVIQATGNVSLASGTSQALMRDLASGVSADQNMAMLNARREAWGLGEEAAMMREEAKFRRKEAKTTASWAKKSWNFNQWLT